jgi:hypothetical protein
MRFLNGAIFARGHRLRARVAAVLAAAALVLMSSLPAHAADALAAARARWQTADFSAYEYGYRKHCECYRDAPPETRVTVRDGRVLDVRHRHAGFDEDVRAEARNFAAYWTVDDLFDLVARALGRGDRVRVANDETLGYPSELVIDDDEALIGVELELELTRVTPLPR